MPITVLSTSADTFFHASLRTVLGHYDGMTQLDKVWDNDAQLLQILQDLKPDVFLMEVQFQGGHKTSLLPQIQAASPATKTILFFDFLNHHDVIEAIMQGAKGCIRKTSAPEQWLKAIQMIHDGDIWVDRKVLVEGLNKLLHPALNRPHPFESKPEILTAREWQVISWVSQGMTNKEIARQLIISDTTVKTHLQNIFNKLKVGRRMQLPLSPGNRI